METLNQLLVDELILTKEAGIPVSYEAIEHAKTDDLSLYSGINIEQLASLFCEFYQG